MMSNTVRRRGSLIQPEGPPSTPKHTEYPRSRLRGYCGRSIPTPPQRASPTREPAAPPRPRLEPARVSPSRPVSLALPATACAQWRASSPCRLAKSPSSGRWSGSPKAGLPRESLGRATTAEHRPIRSSTAAALALTDTGHHRTPPGCPGYQPRYQREENEERQLRSARIDPRRAFVPRIQTSVILSSLILEQRNI